MHRNTIKALVIAVGAALITALVALFFIHTKAPDTPPHSALLARPASSLPQAEPERIRYIEENGLELPAVGSTGYTLINTPLYQAPQQQEQATLPPGTSFAVHQEEGGWWRIEGDGINGWVESSQCMINLPDVIPSIVYDDTNAYASVFACLGQPIPGITDRQLYEAQSYNERLEREEFIMPVLYPMAKRLCAAQQAALAEGNTLVIIEAFRPMETQKAVANAVTALGEEDAAVKEAITAPPWGIDWFIATGVSNHQQGYAVDLTMARVNSTEEKELGLYDYTVVNHNTRYEMQTPIHELSPASAALSAPVDPATDAWKTAEPAAAMNAGALLLHRYCTEAGMTPLASEWWHFNDYTALTDTIKSQAVGNFTTSVCHSFAPPDPN